MHSEKLTRVSLTGFKSVLSSSLHTFPREEISDGEFDITCIHGDSKVSSRLRLRHPDWTPGSEKEYLLGHRWD